MTGKLIKTEVQTEPISQVFTSNRLTYFRVLHKLIQLPEVLVINQGRNYLGTRFWNVNTDQNDVQIQYLRYFDWKRL